MCLGHEKHHTAISSPCSCSKICSCAVISPSKPWLFLWNRTFRDQGKICKCAPRRTRSPLWLLLISSNKFPALIHIWGCSLQRSACSFSRWLLAYLCSYWNHPAFPPFEPAEPVHVCVGTLYSSLCQQAICCLLSIAQLGRTGSTKVSLLMSPGCLKFETKSWLQHISHSIKAFLAIPAETFMHGLTVMSQVWVRGHLSADGRCVGSLLAGRSCQGLTPAAPSTIVLSKEMCKSMRTVEKKDLLLLISRHFFNLQLVFPPPTTHFPLLISFTIPLSPLILYMYGVISSEFKLISFPQEWVLTGPASYPWCTCWTSQHQTAATPLHFKQRLFESGLLFILDGNKLASFSVLN